MYKKFWSENLKGRIYSEDISVDGRIILEWRLGVPQNRSGRGGEEKISQPLPRI
jgi:hypothetical protein